MSTEATLEDRDRAETVFRRSYAYNDYNAIMEVVADKDGLTVDDAVFIPWEWIDRAKLIARAPSAKFGP